jgi:chromatin segregation and condensation protein Rec8/ScpA/Scc1 (kleisin family)
VRRIKEGNISLDSLVEAIGTILEKSKKKRSKVFERESVEFKVPLAGFNVEQRMGEVYENIKSSADSQGLVLFTALLSGSNPVDVVRTFIPCLFLFNNGSINMWQDDFWGEIFISVAEEEAPSKGK